MHFNRLQVLLIRERLISYFQKSNLASRSKANRSGKYAIRDLLCDIVYSDERFLNLDIPEDETAPYDHYFPIKDDGLRRFIARKQFSMAMDSIALVYRFLVEVGSIDPRQVEGLRNAEQLALPMHPDKECYPLIANHAEGEYVHNQHQESMVCGSIMAFRPENTKQLRVLWQYLHFEKKLGPDYGSSI